MELELQQFCATQIDPVKIDREAMISDDVVRGLGKLGVLGACLPKSVGGRELSQASYCKLLEVLGGHCASTALFVNAQIIPSARGPWCCLVLRSSRKSICRNRPAANGSVRLR
ncbi:MAG: acyl-CoA dehydrogenase family protein [Pirellulales bacterium]